MPISNNINGVWRDVQEANVNINGVWRTADAYNNINGVWRQSISYQLKESDILGFKIIYTLNPNKKSELYPDLIYNPKVPIEMTLTGVSSNNMDYSVKGIRYKHDRKVFDEYGINAYDGKIYAMLLDNKAIDIGNIDNSTNNEMGLYNKCVEDLSIQIDGFVKYVSNGWFFEGWNNMFSKKQVFPEFHYPDKDEEEIFMVRDYVLLPIKDRDPNFNSIASVGVARDLHSEINMVGTYGVMDHTYTRILVNRVPKPFSIEIYN